LDKPKKPESSTVTVQPPSVEYCTVTENSASRIVIDNEKVIVTTTPPIWKLGANTVFLNVSIPVIDPEMSINERTLAETLPETLTLISHPGPGLDIATSNFKTKLMSNEIKSVFFSPWSSSKLPAFFVFVFFPAPGKLLVTSI
jgi:hypothetical protein